MDPRTFIIAMYCLIDEWVRPQSRLRRWGIALLSDSEALTMEVVGEYLGIATDTAAIAPGPRHLRAASDKSVAVAGAGAAVAGPTR